MKILLAPSENKSQGGSFEAIALNDLLFNKENSIREHLLKKYNDFIHSDNIDEIAKLFGVKDVKKVAHFTNDIFNAPTMKAIERYSGVAFEYLQYTHLDKSAQQYIDNNTIIFSNLFGPILASDKIPEYKLKQGEKLEGTAIEKSYKEAFSPLLDEYLQHEDILDLRAGFYDKFYKPSKPYTTLKFIKDGKVVGHWAKAYRGIVLREIAKAGINSLEEFTTFKIEGIEFIEEKTTKLKTERIYKIV